MFEFDGSDMFENSWDRAMYIPFSIDGLWALMHSHAYGMGSLHICKLLSTVQSAGFGTER